MDNLDSLPTLKRLMGEGVVFKNTFSTGPVTPISFPGIIAGVYAYDFGTRLSEHVKTIDQIAAEAGYNTAFIGEAQCFLSPFFGYGRNIHYSRDLLQFSTFGPDRNFTDVLMKKEALRDPKGMWGKLQNRVSLQSGMLSRIFYAATLIPTFLMEYTKSDNPASHRSKARLHNKFVAEIEEFVDGNFARPQFLWVHSMINHLPYLPAAGTRFSESEINYLNYRGLVKLGIPRFGKGCVRKLKELYIDSLRTTDEFIGRMLLALESNGHLKNSVIIVTSDHGEEFMEEGFYEHNPMSCSDSLLNIPLIFYAPSIFGKKIVNGPVSTLDILPTVCDMLSVEKPNTARGISLWDILVNEGNVKLEDGLWSRAIFSEGWNRQSWSDCGRGDDIPERVFVAREGRFALKLKQKLKERAPVQEEYTLRDWVRNENLEIEEHRDEFDKLRKHLSDHLRRPRGEETAEYVEPYTPEEEQELRRRLANLGYL
jgi:arylsulfatase A-like enzyme